MYWWFKTLELYISMHAFIYTNMLVHEAYFLFPDKY